MSMLKAGSLLLALAISAGPGYSRSAPPSTFLEGLTTSVADGDTLTVLDAAKVSHRVRLLGIDAPERGQPYGKVARQVLLERVIGKRLRVLVQSKDPYGRSVGKVLLGGTDINLELVRAGLAWHYKHFADDQLPGDARLYAQAEREARLARTGLWAEPMPLPPWEWRRKHGRRGTSPGIKSLAGNGREKMGGTQRKTSLS
jgi:endonuclease YncB( thermonuclease family)